MAAIDLAGVIIRVPRREGCSPLCGCAQARQVYGCHCEPVHGGPAKGHPLRGEEPQGSVAPPLAFGRWGAWRTLGRRGVAIRFPAEKPGNLVLLRANSYALSRIRLRHCPLPCPTAGEADCPVAPLLAMTCRNLPPVRTIPGHCRCTAGKRPYNRRRVAVFSMSLRTSAKWNRAAPVRPGEGDAAERLRPGFSGGKARAKDA